LGESQSDQNWWSMDVFGNFLAEEDLK
jgi:hypothetical protein